MHVHGKSWYQCLVSLCLCVSPFLLFFPSFLSSFPAFLVTCRVRLLLLRAGVRASFSLFLSLCSYSLCACVYLYIYTSLSLSLFPSLSLSMQMKTPSLYRCVVMHIYITHTHTLLSFPLYLLFHLCVCVYIAGISFLKKHLGIFFWPLLKSCGFVLSYVNRPPCIGVDWLEGAVDLSPNWRAPTFPWYLTL
jgi:hypothetical protein